VCIYLKLAQKFFVICYLFTVILVCLLFSCVVVCPSFKLKHIYCYCYFNGISFIWDLIDYCGTLSCVFAMTCLIHYYQLFVSELVLGRITVIFGTCSCIAVSLTRRVIGGGTAGATGALAPAILKPRGWKYLFAPAIICQVYLLVDSQSARSLYSFKILNLNLIMYSQLGIFY